MNTMSRQVLSQEIVGNIGSMLACALHDAEKKAGYAGYHNLAAMPADHEVRIQYGQIYTELTTAMRRIEWLAAQEV